MVVLMMFPIAIPIKMTLFPANPGISVSTAFSSENLVEGEDLSQIDPLLVLVPSSLDINLGRFQDSEASSEIDILLAMREGDVKKKKKPRREDDFSFWEVINKADFRLLAWSTFLGLVLESPSSIIWRRLGYHLVFDNETILLSLFIFRNFLGRIGAGALSEHFVRSNMIPRTIWMTLTQIIMIIAFLLYTSGISGTLYAATTFLGICYGVQFSIMIPTASELFGLKNFGIIFNFIQIGNPLGALLFSSLHAGYVYDSEAAKLGGPSCLGPDCFRLTFFVLASMCGLGSVLRLVLTLRIRPLYQMIYGGGSFRVSQASGH